MTHNQFIILALISFLFFSSEIVAQDFEDGDLPEILPRPNVISPQVADIIKYETVGTNIYRGSVDFNVQLIPFSDPDFNMEIAVRYETDGFQFAKSH